MYGCDVIIFEGILAFHHPEICKLMDLKIFVDTDSDTRFLGITIWFNSIFW